MPAIKTVFMFSGQGSQFFQMGKELYERNEVFRDTANRLDALVREATGARVLEAIYSRSKSEPFDRTTLTHPAIFIVEIATARALMHAGVRPDLVLGASLGSFAAAAIAGFMEIDTALMAVVRQAAALESCEPGGMIAVLGSPTLFAERVFAGSELAATNFDAHFVVSALRSRLEQIEAELRERNIAHQRLAVSAAFHSRWIDAARASFEGALCEVGARTGHLPLVCCDQALPLQSLAEDFLWCCVRQPIRFQETIAQLERAGSFRYIDVGPSGTLATFVKYARPAGSHSTAHAVVTPYGRDLQNLAAVI